MKPSDVLRGALELLPDEDAWSPNGPGDSMNRRCVAVAIVDANVCCEEERWGYKCGGDEALRLVEAEVGRIVGFWNDDPHTTFEDVRLTLKRALARAEESDELS